ncbi:MAG: helix-turn-helix transcriptional regulator, partial [Raoultibacter sp.]
LDIWVQRYGLSARETEVFELLAKGRNRVFISKALFISDNTTRTHMKNIYRKLDVHSQQELIDLLEEERKKPV